MGLNTSTSKHRTSAKILSMISLAISLVYGLVRQFTVTSCTLQIDILSCLFDLIIYYHYLVYFSDLRFIMIVLSNLPFGSVFN